MIAAVPAGPTSTCASRLRHSPRSISFLEKEYNVEIKDEELLPENLDSLSRIADFIRRKLEPHNRG